MNRFVKLPTMLTLAATPFLAGIAHAGPYQDVLLPGEELGNSWDCLYSYSSTDWPIHRFKLDLHDNGEVLLMDLTAGPGSDLKRNDLWDSRPYSSKPNDWGVIWGSNRAVSANLGATARLMMRPDGNLVVYFEAWGPWAPAFGSAPPGYSGPFVLWESGTPGNPGAFLVLQADGKLVIYKWTVISLGNGLVFYWPVVLWQTGSGDGSSGFPW